MGGGHAVRKVHVAFERALLNGGSHWDSTMSPMKMTNDVDVLRESSEETTTKGVHFIQANLG
jgi:hypothetical protein